MIAVCCYAAPYKCGVERKGAARTGRSGIICDSMTFDRKLARMSPPKTACVIQWLYESRITRRTRLKRLFFCLSCAQRERFVLMSTVIISYS
jgi:hypothetical protein